MQDIGKQATLDPSALNNILALQRPGTPDIVTKIANIFLGSAGDQVAGICNAAHGQDSQTLAAFAHSLKSSSANLGAVEFSRLCRELEHDARQGKLPANDILESLQREFQEVCEALEKLIAERAA